MVPDQEMVKCPECSGGMYPRDGEERARHFYHVGTDAENSCSKAGQGESDTHARCVALAVAALEEVFGDQARICAPEVTIDVSGTDTAPDHRRADALLEFKNKDPYFGTGLIIEVQYRHHSKDIEGTTHDYLAAGYSVAWVSAGEFGEKAFDYSIVDEAFRSEDKQAFSICEHDPWNFDVKVSANFRWDDPDPGCDHAWIRIPAYAHPQGYEYEFCKYCKSRRVYDDDLTRFVYDYKGVLAPQIEPQELDEVRVKGRASTEEKPEWSTDTPFEDGLAWKTTVAPCRGPNGVHEWGEPEEVGGNCVVWECQYCPVRLLGNPHWDLKLIGNPKWDLAGLRKDPSTCNHYCHSKGYNFDYCPDCYLSNP